MAFDKVFVADSAVPAWRPTWRAAATWAASAPDWASWSSAIWRSLSSDSPFSRPSACANAEERSATMAASSARADSAARSASPARSSAPRASACRPEQTKRQRRLETNRQIRIETNVTSETKQMSNRK
eukprot:1196051-Prorocentrum_minimum.AAC.2